ncbi:helix-turn-helix domain-containing protein [Streptomyces sp. RS10V-4]|uniref:helix-turn-helix domain-containing protein n=1 Tax=Streptomyces rhizoryzae TaxID=2932493 RepID=UPI0020067CB4|nr:helix-turn-helix transcriptional regulator [Streptomyces rhizoryzae]MCK7626702.1 helix-turn-helix domain-containing protein [Streptomyces rhizoryzae]
MSGLLEDDRLLRACAERDMGAVFRMLNSRGVSTRRLAAAAGITQGRLYDYMNGKSRVEKLSLFEQIADAFRIPGRLLGLARRSWEPAPVDVAHQRADRPPPDGDDLAAVGHFRSADRQTGGGRLYGAVVRHLRDRVAPRLVDADGGPEVFAAAAALTEMAGWMAHDSGHDDRAGRHFARALPLARAAGDLPLAANIAASSSHLALQAGNPAAAADWARTGLRLAAQGPRVPALTARLHTMQARAHAAAVQRDPAVRALDAARRDLDQALGASHPWLSPFDVAALASESALVLRDLGQHDEALACAEQAVALRQTGRERSLALSRIILVGVHVRRHDIDAAVSVGHDLLGTSPTLGSVRVVRQLDALGRLLTPHRGYGPVREYLVRFDAARRARMLLLADIIPPPPGGTPYEAHRTRPR